MMAPELQNALSDLDAKDTALQGLAAQAQTAAVLLTNHAAAQTARQEALANVRRLLAQHYPDAQTPAAPVAAATSTIGGLARLLHQRAAAASAAATSPPATS